MTEPVHLRHTAESRRILDLALREALQLGHNQIASEHILLGIVRDGDNLAADVLADAVGDLAEIRKKVIQRLAGRHGDEAERLKLIRLQAKLDELQAEINQLKTGDQK